MANLFEEMFEKEHRLMLALAEADKEGTSGILQSLKEVRAEGRKMCHDIAEESGMDEALVSSVWSKYRIDRKMGRPSYEMDALEEVIPSAVQVVAENIAVLRYVGVGTFVLSGTGDRMFRMLHIVEQCGCGACMDDIEAFVDEDLDRLDIKIEG